MTDSRFWILHRYKPVIAAYFHAKANMQGITNADNLLLVPRIYYHIVYGMADMIRFESDRQNYMQELEKLMHEDPDKINALIGEGLKSNSEIIKLIDDVNRLDFENSNLGKLKNLLDKFDKLLPQNWLKATFLPYYIGDVPGFERVIDTELIRQSRLHTYADESIPQMIKLAEGILQETGQDPDFAECYSYDELKGTIENPSNLDFKAIQMRKRECFIFVENGKTEISIGKKAIEMAQKFKESQKPILSLKGMPAFAGLIKGKAFVAKNANDLKRMKKNSILVTHMTTPDFVPYLDKVIGIITDEGGINCHAAIISREMKIPCIVGTKNSTKFINTGDLIRIDSVTGIITKL